MIFLSTPVIIAILLVCMLVVLQSQRDEARSCDAIVVAPQQQIQQEQLDHALSLYRQGYAPHLLIRGIDTDTARALEQKYDLPEGTILIVESGQYRPLQQVAQLAYQHGIQRIILVDRPASMLLALKMAGDLELEGYGAPLPDTPLRADEVLRASLDYWSYIFFGSSAPCCYSIRSQTGRTT
ncbi:MAG: hypothetical protein HC837_00895 [Chloroflexaceae bacterium]|nr:hypothetical protein [Chloroflexaceae bacterium]